MKSTLDIRIEEDLKQKLREIAKKRHRSMTQQIEHWIDVTYEDDHVFDRNNSWHTLECNTGIGYAGDNTVVTDCTADVYNEPTDLPNGTTISNGDGCVNTATEE